MTVHKDIVGKVMCRMSRNGDTTDPLFNNVDCMNCLRLGVASGYTAAATRLSALQTGPVTINVIVPAATPRPRGRGVLHARYGRHKNSTICGQRDNGDAMVPSWLQTTCLDCLRLGAQPGHDYSYVEGCTVRIVEVETAAAKTDWVICTRPHKCSRSRGIVVTSKHVEGATCLECLRLIPYDSRYVRETIDALVAAGWDAPTARAPAAVAPRLVVPPTYRACPRCSAKIVYEGFTGVECAAGCRL